MKGNKDKQWVQTQEKIKKMRQRLINEFKHIKKRSLKTKKNQQQLPRKQKDIEQDLKSPYKNLSPSVQIFQESEMSSPALSKTYRGSYNSIGRLSKLSEEEASDVYAQRRKELLGNLIQQRKKVERKKTPVKRVKQRTISPTMRKKLKATCGDLPSPEQSRLQPNFVIFSGQNNNYQHQKKIHQLHEQEVPKSPIKKIRINKIQILSEERRTPHQRKRRKKKQQLSNSVLDLPEPVSYDMIPQMIEDNPSRHHSDGGIIKSLEQDGQIILTLEDENVELLAQSVDFKNPNKNIIQRHKQHQRKTQKLIEMTHQQRKEATKKLEFFNTRNRTQPNLPKYTKRQKDIIKSRKQEKEYFPNSYFKRNSHKNKGKLLFEKAKSQQEQKKRQQQLQREKIQKKQREECTFTPSINEEQYYKKQKKLWQRAINIDKERTSKRERDKKKKLEAQLRKCTFTPRLNKKSKLMAASLNDDFFIRSMKWKKKREKSVFKQRELKSNKYQKYTKSKTPRQHYRKRKESVFLPITPQNERRSNSSLVFDNQQRKNALFQIQQRKQFLEQEKEHLQKQITQRRRRSKSPFRQKYSLQKKEVEEENSPVIQLTVENEPTQDQNFENLKKEIEIRKSQRKIQKDQMEEIFSDQINTTLTIFEEMGKFLKPEKVPLTPKRESNLKQQAYIHQKTSSAMKHKKTHIKTPSIQDIAPVQNVLLQNSPFKSWISDKEEEKTPVKSRKDSPKYGKFIKQSEEYQSLLKKANKINSRIKMSRDSIESLYTRFYE